MPTLTSSKEKVVRVLRLRIKDKHAAALRDKAYWVNQVWNYVNELSFKVWERERKFLLGYDFATYTKGASKAGVALHSQSIQAIAEEYANKRKQARKVKLRWRVSGGSRRSLGWIPFKATALRYRNGQLWLSGIDKPLGLWDSYGLSGYDLGTGNVSEDARGRWYINICATPKAKPMQRPTLFSDSVGVDLGLKDFVATSDGAVIEAQNLYRALEAKLRVAQRAKKTNGTRAIHAKIANRRKDFHHQLSRRLVDSYAAIFIGNVNAAALAKTRLAKSVMDAGWSQFRTMLKYKSAYAGVWFEEVNEAYSTVTCSDCKKRTGPIVREGLRIREWTCSGCSAHHHRDVNASRNILALGLGRLAGGIPVLTAQAAAEG
ncbi:RNA-guided endonuclease InsQ/TnpB family protein [Noviherbaspirillum galbum]|uniref:IS200/IS605 family element transposase accessory protein TnpB n=1 Tax=Noviherbaspirillum galbum TaxID=2709383 RepID=A0A6B3SH83_9BURK|nr:RNA-guided endonuclease TnpB family protein [Noviherbaspirillum galbum]NEX60221.1 IS200/IS605 family element transposase accessory protein TnpB [Noviherbaspirillum galbum]